MLWMYNLIQMKKNADVMVVKYFMFQTFLFDLDLLLKRTPQVYTGIIWSGRKVILHFKGLIYLQIWCAPSAGGGGGAIM